MTETDKELLELAAKAAGIANLQWESDGTMQNRMNRPTIPYECHGMSSATDWNPLRNDGDALRLAVKLHLDITAYPVTQEVGAVQHKHNGVCCGILNRCFERYDKDPYAATRRAIVRAAAEI